LTEYEFMSFVSGMIAAQSTKSKPAPLVHRKARVPGMAEAARRIGCTPGHLYRVVTGERRSPNAAKYRRTLEKVQREAGLGTQGGAR
jgi:hypothetical protein